MRQFNRGALLIPFYFTLIVGCSKKNYVHRFVNNDSQSLIDFRDRDGHHWKLLSANGDTIRLYTLLSKSGSIKAMSVSWKHSSDTTSYVLYLDSNYRAVALDILNKNYLANLRNADSAYTSWVNRNVVFGGTGPITHRTHTSLPGSLGDGDVRVADGQIVATLQQVKCSCADGGLDCSLVDPVMRQCLNRICAWINCWVQDIRTPGRCLAEAGDAKAACELAAEE